MRESLADRYEQLAIELGWSPDRAPDLIRSSMKTLTDLRRVLTDGGMVTDPECLEAMIASRKKERQGLGEDREKLEFLQRVLRQHDLPDMPSDLDHRLREIALGHLSDGGAIVLNRFMGHKVEDLRGALDALQTYGLPVKGLKEALKMRFAFAPERAEIASELTAELDKLQHLAEEEGDWPAGRLVDIVIHKLKEARAVADYRREAIEQIPDIGTEDYQVAVARVLRERERLEKKVLAHDMAVSHLRDLLKHEENRRELAELEAQRVGELYYKSDDEVTKLKGELAALKEMRGESMARLSQCESMYRQALNLVLDEMPEGVCARMRLDDVNMKRRFREQRKQLRNLNRKYKEALDACAWVVRSSGQAETVDGWATVTDSGAVEAALKIVGE